MVRLKKAQSSLELAMVLVATALLTMAVMKSWNWFNENMVNRMKAYNQGRLAAGSSNPGHAADYSQTKLQFF